MDKSSVFFVAQTGRSSEVGFWELSAKDFLLVVSMFGDIMRPQSACEAGPLLQIWSSK